MKSHLFIFVQVAEWQVAAKPQEVKACLGSFDVGLRARSGLQVAEGLRHDHVVVQGVFPGSLRHVSRPRLEILEPRL